jgi:predicted RNA-binding protein YlxR (DUF448 family)
MLSRPHDEELDAGPRKAGSERLCVATGAVRPIEEMIRFVVAPDGAPVPDLRRRLPGRGLWITATRDALATAVARKAFARGFRRDVRVAPDFVEATERLIERAALDALAIAHKAGKVAIGFGKTEAAIANDNVAAIVHAADAAPDGTRKLGAALRRRYGDGAEGTPVLAGFTSAQLDLALGRSNVIHAALLAGPESETVLARAARLDRFRSASSGTKDPRAAARRERR